MTYLIFGYKAIKKKLQFFQMKVDNLLKNDL